ncbi:MAG: peptidoglycan-binding domain-containing protein, partial [Pseudomonadota bacterium]
PELASATTPGFVPAPEPAEPAAPIATGDEGDKGLVIAALPTNRVEPPEPASPPTPSDAAFVPTLSDVDRQRAALWRALALSFDLAAIQSFADDHRRTAEGEAAAERVAVLKRLHREGQQQLNRSGYWAGTPDGIWGPRSARALRRFEKAQGLSETGVLTDALLARLRDMPTKRAAQPKRTPSASASRQSSGGGGTAASQPSFKPVTDPAPAPTASAEPAAPAPDPAPARPSPSVETDWEPFNDHSSM